MNHISLVQCYCISLIKCISLAQARYKSLHGISMDNVHSTYSHESSKSTPHDHKPLTLYINIDFTLIQSPQTTTFIYSFYHCSPNITLWFNLLFPNVLIELAKHQKLNWRLRWCWKNYESINKGKFSTRKVLKPYKICWSLVVTIMRCQFISIYPPSKYFVTNLTTTNRWNE